MVIGAVVVGYCRECTGELTQEQQGTSKIFKGKIIPLVLLYTIVGLLINLLFLIIPSNNPSSQNHNFIRYIKHSYYSFCILLVTFNVVSVDYCIIPVHMHQHHIC